MSHRKTFLVSAGLFFLISAGSTMCFPGLANPLTYVAPTENQSGSFQGELPIERIGPLQLPKAVVQFEGSHVNVLAVPDWLFDRNLVLSGPLVKGQIDLQGLNSKMNGLVYFLQGLWLTNLGSNNATDVIDTISGEQLRGRIRTELDSAFAFKPDNGPMRKLQFTDIKNISSPRAYWVSIPITSGKVVPSGNSVQFDSNSISFICTFGHGLMAAKPKTPQSTLAGTEPGISKAQIGTLIGINIANEIAPAIAIPLVLNGSTVNYAKRKLNHFQSQQPNFVFGPQL